MADRNKFEEMLEKLVAEDRKGAEELFHEIVVEKSRNIYENLLIYLHSGDTFFRFYRKINNFALRLHTLSTHS